MPVPVSRSLVAKKDFEKHVPDTHISHFSSSESNAITSKKREESMTIRVDTIKENDERREDSQKKSWSIQEIIKHVLMT